MKERICATAGCYEPSKKRSGRAKPHKYCGKCLYQKSNPKDPEKQLERCLKREKYGKKYRRNIKIEALVAYSVGDIPKCACCGETTIDFLTLDHVNNDGAAHRKMFFGPNDTKSGNWFYRKLRDAGWPNDVPLQVLCANCNLGKMIHGICPHQMDHDPWAEDKVKFGPLSKHFSGTGGS